jgi:prepilin-type processing-associated H-X9-DG protein
VWTGDLAAMYGVATKSVPTFVCPSDPTGLEGTGGKAVTPFGGKPYTMTGPLPHAAGCYVANYYVFGGPDRETITARLEGTGRNNLTRACTDGLSKTILFAEKYASCGTATSPNDDFVCFTGWTNPNGYFRPSFCINDMTQHPYTRESDKSEPYKCLAFQDAPHWWRNCDPARTQTPHVGAMNVALADGSVRSMASEVSLTAWHRACNPRDGEIANEEW